MQNKFESSEVTLVVLPEMEELLSPLNAEQFFALERDILENGCSAPLIINENRNIIDGHNRFRICEQHGLPFKMLVFSLADMLEAKRWALDTQKGHHNLEKWELGKIALKSKPEVETRAKTNMSAGCGGQKSGNVKSVLAMLPNSISSVDTRKELADAVGLGEHTMGKVMQIDKYAPAAIRETLDRKELFISQGYNISRQIQEFPKEEQKKAAFMVIELEKAKKEIRQADAESNRRHKIARPFCCRLQRKISVSGRNTPA